MVVYSLSYCPFVHYLIYIILLIFLFTNTLNNAGYVHTSKTIYVVTSVAYCCLCFLV